MGDEALGERSVTAAIIRALSAQTSALQRALGAAGTVPGDLAALLAVPSEATAGAIGGARGTAAMEAQRRYLEARPGRAIVTTRELLARANGTDSPQRQDARAFFERHGRFPSSVRGVFHTAFMLASVWKFGAAFGAWLGIMYGGERGLDQDTAEDYEAHLAAGRWVVAADVRRRDRQSARGALVESGALEARDVRGTFEPKPTVHWLKKY